MPGKARRQRTIRDQRYVVVRIDVIVYVLVGVIALLALASVAWPDRVELALVGSLGTMMAGVLVGWFAFMRFVSKDDGNGPNEGG